MKELIRKWFGLDALEAKQIEEDRKIAALAKELVASVSMGVGEFPQKESVQEYMWALMRYLDVVPYIELHKDYQALAEHLDEPRIRVLKMGKRGKVKNQVVMID